jgi:hypothetical protein
MNGEEVGRPESRYLDRARTLAQHAEARGATLAAWSATTLAFSWDTDSIEEAVDFACEVNGAEGVEKTWACAIARGELQPLNLAPEGSKGGARADLAWGEPLVAAVILARAARAGEVLVEASFAGLDGFIVTGKRLARDGERRVRGMRIDPRQPWKRDVGQGVERLVTPRLIGRPDPRALLARPGIVHVLRADPGQGGTRMLAEIARAAAPGPSVFVAPAGGSVEPLGALRRALVRALASRPYPEDPELGPALDMFLGGIGASIEQASALVGTFLRSRAPGEPPGALLVDDAGDIDAESLEACAQLIAWMPSPFHVIVRVDATDPLPPAFATIRVGQEIVLGPLDRGDAERMAREATGGALDARTARRIARRAANTPLAIMEALAFGLTSGEIAWVGERAALRTASSLAGKPAGAARWISKRAKATASDERGVLATIALLGGEAPLESVKDVLAQIEPTIAVDAEVRKLTLRHWLVQSLPGWVALPSRTHRETIADLLDEAPRRALNRAIADVLEQSEGELGCAEAANHAVKGGDGERGARLALRAARAAQVAGMSKSATRLMTLARLADPKCEPLTRQPPNGPASSRPQMPIAHPPVPPSRPIEPPLTGRTAWSAPVDDAPTQRLTALNAGQAARLIDAARTEDRDSDFPTVINAPAYAVERPARPSGPDPVPDYVLQPPPRSAPTPRLSVRGMPAVAPRAPEGAPSLPKPSAPLPMRPSVQSMPAVVPRSPDVVVPRVVVPGRPSVQMAALRAPAPPVAGPPSPLRPAVVVVPEETDEEDAQTGAPSPEGRLLVTEHERAAERIEAMALLSRGQVGEALRSLRALREGDEVPLPSARNRAQTSLALGVGLAAANRPDEALLEALDALARAREGGDTRAEGACLAFLAKLFGRVERGEDAAALSAAAKG